MAKDAGVVEEEMVLTGTQKAAALLVSLSKESASAILSHLGHEHIEEVTQQIATMESFITSEKREKAVDEFYNLAIARSYVQVGGLAYARGLLEESMPKDDVDALMEQIEQSIRTSPFAFAQKAESESLLTFIQGEHPQTVALILAHLPSGKASDILAGLPPDKKTDVVMRIATMDQTNPEVIKEVERGLELRLSAIMNQKFEKAGGVETVAAILNLADRTTEKGILDALDSEDPDLAEQIRRLMFVFEDILLVNDKGIQSVLKEIENDALALALRTASDEVKEKVFGNMSERAAELIKEDMEYMGPVKLSSVESAQQKIVDVVRRLEEAGEIFISGRGESELVV